MKVQIIGNSTVDYSCSTIEITMSLLSAPKSLDEFDINIVDLTSEHIWRYPGSDSISIYCLNDFASIQKMVVKKSLSKVIYLLPKNICLKYFQKPGNDGYYRSKPLKDILDTVRNRILSEIVPNKCSIPTLIFENTRTMLNKLVYEADFYFDTKYNIITESVRSKKVTTIALEENSIYATTLNIAKSVESLENFILALFNVKEKESVPGWMENITILDDNEQLGVIQNSREMITEAEQKIIKAQEKLVENAKYKSILYTNGDELVTVVFKILEQILACDLSGFADENKEDFLIQKDSFTFIGEIKGVTSNIKNEHISQVDVHFQGYMDRLAEEQRQENVRQLLIINPFRTKPIGEREPINQRQIDLAQRNGCLIIDTNTLLRVFEKFCCKEIAAGECTEIFGTRTGLLEISDFEKPGSKDLEAYKG